MPVDRSFITHNRASTDRMRALTERLTDQELQHPLGEHWTISIALAHLTFWEIRLLQILDTSEQEGHLVAPAIDILVNDLSLPLWALIPPRASARLAVETAEKVDRRLETYPPALLEAVYAANERWVVRSAHRDEHLDEIDAALKG